MTHRGEQSQAVWSQMTEPHNTLTLPADFETKDICSSAIFSWQQRTHKSTSIFTSVEIHGLHKLPLILVCTCRVAKITHASAVIFWFTVLPLPPILRITITPDLLFSQWNVRRLVVFVSQIFLNSPKHLQECVCDRCMSVTVRRRINRHP